MPALPINSGTAKSSRVTDGFTIEATEIDTRDGRDFRVTDYRAYAVGSDGRFISYEPMVCMNDADATERAKRLVDDHDIELWCGPRLVIRLSHKSE